MRPRVLVLLVGIDAAVALSFASAWGLVWQTCAPVSPVCRMSICPTVCVNAWTQFPSNVGFGALLGLVPFVVAALGIGYLDRGGPDRNGPLERLVLAAVVLATAVGSVLFYL